MKSSAMSGRRRFGAVLGAALMTGVMALAVMGPPMAVGQASRTWVSGVGDDVNPCSRTAPCKTFAGAISKTAPSGEINCLDPGGFGGVTITKSLTINCEYTEGGALVAGAGVNGILVNAGAGDIVILRGLDINGAGSAQNGIRILAGAAVYVEDTIIHGFRAASGLGISYQPTGTTELHVRNSTITGNGNANGTGGGILIQPTGASSIARVTISDSEISNNTFGVRVDTNGNSAPNVIRVTVRNSNANGNSGHGFAAIGNAASVTTIQMMIDGCSASYNTLSGVIASTNKATVRIGDCEITGNESQGTNQNSGGIIESYQTNMIRGNTIDGTTIPLNEN
jgi:hypothetical protein